LQFGKQFVIAVFSQSVPIAGNEVCRSESFAQTKIGARTVKPDDDPAISFPLNIFN
jgi:hypothetical protein